MRSLGTQTLHPLFVHPVLQDQLGTFITLLSLVGVEAMNKVGHYFRSLVMHQLNELQFY